MGSFERGGHRGGSWAALAGAALAIVIIGITPRDAHAQSLASSGGAAASTVPPLRLPLFATPTPTPCACPSPAPAQASHSPTRVGAKLRPIGAAQAAPARPAASQAAAAASPGAVAQDAPAPTRPPTAVTSGPPPIGFMGTPDAVLSGSPLSWPIFAVLDALALGVVFFVMRRSRSRLVSD